MRGHSLRWFSRLKPRVDGLVGIETSPQGIALAHVVRPAGGAELRRCVYRECAPERQADTLRALVAEFGLKGAAVNLLLHPSLYRIFLLEAPAVAPDELRDAMRWRVKDMISEPLDEVIVDSFPLPEDAYRGRARMAYCAVLTKTAMQAFEALVEGAGLDLASIDITEMAMRNLALEAVAREHGGNLAWLRLRSSEGLVGVQCGADLYMARRIEQGLAGADQHFDSMALEIQRSLDYFESQLGKGHVSRLLLLPMKQDGDATAAALARGLAAPLQRLMLADLFPGQAAAELPEPDQARCLGAVGAALREEA